MQGDLRVGIHILTEDTDYYSYYLHSASFQIIYNDRPPNRWEVQFENGYGASVIGALCP